MIAPPGPVARPESIEIEERRRVLKVYADYIGDPRYVKRWAKGPGSAFMLARKWSLLALALREAGIDVRAASVLDIGCGSGEDSFRLVEMGFAPSKVFLMDLRLDPTACARSHPESRAIRADASRLPFRDAAFHVIYQSTMLSSVVDTRVRSSILKEIARVLRPGGLLLSYDTRYSNPWNRQTRPLRRWEFRAAIPGWRLRTWSATAIPQIVRLLAPYSAWGCRLLEAIPPLRCHLVVAAVKPDGDLQAGPVA
jgi:ubiquinone/menaquinone biosynthesis C-methylase UbiE